MKNVFYIFSILFSLSCHHSRYSVNSIQNKTVRIDNSIVTPNPALDALIFPYKKSMDSVMNDTIAYADYNLDKKYPESILGNWVTDGMKWYMDSVVETPCDVALCNYGGLRIKSLSKGYIQLKNIYELMPFDNAITLVTLNDSTLKLFLEKVATHGGWPISRGLQMELSAENKLISIKKTPIEKPLYIIAISDYIATGGDQMDMLIKAPQVTTTYKIRDILIAYALYQRKLEAKIEGRILKVKK